LTLVKNIPHVFKLHRFKTLLVKPTKQAQVILILIL